MTDLDLIHCNCSGDYDHLILDVHFGLKETVPCGLGIRDVLKANIKTAVNH